MTMIEGIVRNIPSSNQHVLSEKLRADLNRPLPIFCKQYIQMNLALALRAGKCNRLSKITTVAVLLRNQASLCPFRSLRAFCSLEADIMQLSRNLSGGKTNSSDPAIYSTSMV